MTKRQRAVHLRPDGRRCGNFHAGHPSATFDLVSRRRVDARAARDTSLDPWLSPPSGHGDCVETGGSAECICDSGWAGTTCNDCAPGYFGAPCSKCPCRTGECDDGVAGTGVCTYTSLFTFQSAELVVGRPDFESGATRAFGAASFAYPWG